MVLDLFFVNTEYLEQRIKYGFGFSKVVTLRPNRITEPALNGVFVRASITVDYIFNKLINLSIHN